MIANGRASMGMHKHGVSGQAGKSPKMRHYLKREAEKQNRKSKAQPLRHESVAEAVRASQQTESAHR